MATDLILRIRAVLLLLLVVSHPQTLRTVPSLKVSCANNTNAQVTHDAQLSFSASFLSRKKQKNMYDMYILFLARVLGDLGRAAWSFLA